MIERAQYDKINQKHGWCASWAVWAPRVDTAKSGVGDTTIFLEEKLADLLPVIHTKAVLVGLNISREANLTNFQNFHAGDRRGQDYKLRHAIMGTPLWGSYMTDIIKDWPEVSSANLMRDLKKRPDKERENVETFVDELEFIGAKDPLIVAMGGAVASILERNLAEKFRVIKIPHYAMQINTDVYRGRVAEALAGVRV